MRRRYWWGIILIIIGLWIWLSSLGVPFISFSKNSVMHPGKYKALFMLKKFMIDIIDH